MPPFTCVTRAVPDSVRPLDQVLDAVTSYLAPTTLDHAMYLQLPRILHQYSHLPYSFESVTTAAFFGRGNVVKWAFENAKGEKAWSESQSEQVLEALLMQHTDVSTELVEALSSQCSTDCVSRALDNAAWHKRSTVVHAIAAGRRGKDLNVYPSFMSIVLDSSEEEWEDDGYDEVLLTLAKNCHGREASKALEISIFHSLIACVEVLVHRISSIHARDALRQLLKHDDLASREDLRMALAKRSIAEEIFDVDAFLFLLQQGLHDEAETIARTVHPFYIGIFLRDAINYKLRDEGIILASRISSDTNITDALIALIKSGKHPNVTEMLITTPDISDYDLGHTLMELIEARLERRTEMEKLIERLSSAFYIIELMNAAIKYNNTLWMIECLVDRLHVGGEERYMLKIMQLLCEDQRGVAFWSGTILRLCSKPLHQLMYAPSLLKAALKHKLVDAAKAIVRVNSKQECSSYVADMLRVVADHGDEFREEVENLVKPRVLRSVTGIMSISETKTVSSSETADELAKSVLKRAKNVWKEKETVFVNKNMHVSYISQKMALYVTNNNTLLAEEESNDWFTKALAFLAEEVKVAVEATEPYTSIVDDLSDGLEKVKVTLAENVQQMRLKEAATLATLRASSSGS